MKCLRAAIILLALSMVVHPAQAAEPLSKQLCFHPDYFCPAIPENRHYGSFDHTNRPQFRAPAREPDWHSPWHPRDWIAQRKSPGALVNGFYNAGILKDQYTNDDDIKILEVGPSFYHLSQRDQRRVADALSYIYRPGIFYLSDWYSNRIIASYTPRYGLIRE